MSTRCGFLQLVMGSLVLCIGISLACEAEPEIIVRQTPAVLISLNGSPLLSPIPGTELMLVRNSSESMLYLPSTGRYYTVVGGRWFSTAALESPFVRHTEALPPAFLQLPPEGHPASALRPWVAGTPEAEVLVASLSEPVKAVVNREVVHLEVTYAGTPEFVPVEGTPWQRAANTDYTVLASGGRCFCCHQGVWFVADNPLGPWVVCDHTPPGLDSLSVDSDLSHLAECQVYAATGDMVVVGYTGGYVGYSEEAGVVVYEPVPTGSASYETTQGANAYAQWGISTVGTADHWAQTAHYSGSAVSVGGLTTASGWSAVGFDGPNHQGAVVKTPGGDVYIRADGNTYQWEDGQLSKFDDGAWEQVSPAQDKLNGSAIGESQASREPKALKSEAGSTARKTVGTQTQSQFRQTNTTQSHLDQIQRRNAVQRRGGGFGRRR